VLQQFAEGQGPEEALLERAKMLLPWYVGEWLGNGRSVPGDLENGIVLPSFHGGLALFGEPAYYYHPNQ